LGLLGLGPLAFWQFPRWEVIPHPSLPSLISLITLYTHQRVARYFNGSQQQLFLHSKQHSFFTRLRHSCRVAFPQTFLFKCCCSAHLIKHNNS
jgi:hypothetical protein